MFTDIQEAIRYIESKYIPKSVEAYQEILDRNNIHLKAKHIIHVTGTNGKGSTIHYLSQFLMAASYSVGTFTSPYLISYHDRFCVNGVPIDDQSLLDIVNSNYELIEKERLSKFEIDILIMIEYFNSLPLDYVIVEVGVGGKEDKTNVVDSEVSIIVNIGKDHLPRLGNTILDICEHKVGIIKPNSLVYTSVKQEKCLKMIKEVAESKNSKVVIVDEIEPFNYGKLARYQYMNISLAYQVLTGLGVHLSKEKVQEVIDSTFWKGRFEYFDYQGHSIIIDGAHNEDGIIALIDSLQSTSKDYIVIFSALRDKDYPEMIRLLEKYYPVYVTVFEDERKMTLDDLSQFTNSFSHFEEALNQAMKSNNIVITGSLHFISYVRDYLVKHKA